MLYCRESAKTKILFTRSVYKQPKVSEKDFRTQFEKNIYSRFFISNSIHTYLGNENIAIFCNCLTLLHFEQTQSLSRRGSITFGISSSIICSKLIDRYLFII